MSKNRRLFSLDALDEKDLNKRHGKGKMTEGEWGRKKGRVTVRTCSDVSREHRIDAPVSFHSPSTVKLSAACCQMARMM